MTQFHDPHPTAVPMTHLIDGMQGTDARAEPMAAPQDEEVLFDAVLMPHRSLGPVGFKIVMGVVIGFSLIGGIIFASMGAWPVFGYFGLDALLIYGAFRLSYRSGRMHEVVRLTRQELLVERVDPSGSRQSWRFQPYWLRVELESPMRHESPLELWSHGRRLVIGSFLTPDERQEVAIALRNALARVRTAPSAPAEP